MSDPMTNMEIEDVLSSIRRLVSEDVRPAARSESPPVVPVGLQPVDRLVLTPAFRVADPAPARAAPPLGTEAEYRECAAAGMPMAAPEAMAEPAGEVHAGSAEPVLAGIDADGAAGIDADAVAGIGAGIDADAVAATGADWAADAALDGIGARPSRRGAAVPEVATALAVPEGFSWEDADDFAADPGGAAAPSAAGPLADAEDVWPMAAAHAGLTGAELGQVPLPADADELARLEETIAELEAAVAASGGEWEPDGSEPGASAMFVLPSIAAGRAGVAGPRPASAGPRRLHLGAAVGPEAQEWRDAEPAPSGGLSGLTGDADDPAVVAKDGPDFFAEPEDAILDETMLRELVIEIIRQELQGALGERITRNVRKLVRAEIHRAMAGREFD